MELEIKSWGNSGALRLNKTLLDQLSVKIGALLSVEVLDGTLVLKPAEPAITMESLLAGCTEDNMRLSDDDREWLNGSVGNEFR